MNKKYYNELINIKHKVVFIINNLHLNNVSFDKNYIKNVESSLLISNIYNLDNKKIYKTLYSLIIIQNNTLYCYNNKSYKQLSISIYETIYSNDEFYVKINSNNNNIVFIDNNFKTKRMRSQFIINEIIVNQKFMILIGINNNILINNKNIYNFMEYKVVDLYNFILFYNIKKSILINNNGYIVNCKINNENVKIILDLIKPFSKIENLIKCYVNENYIK